MAVRLARQPFVRVQRDHVALRASAADLSIGLLATATA
jgi:hypothetical protein